MPPTNTPIWATPAARSPRLIPSIPSLPTLELPQPPNSSHSRSISSSAMQSSDQRRVSPRTRVQLPWVEDVSGAPNVDSSRASRNTQLRRTRSIHGSRNQAVPPSLTHVASSNRDFHLPDEYRLSSENRGPAAIPRRSNIPPPQSNQMRMPPLNHAPWLGPTYDDDGNLQDNLAEDYTSLYQQSPQSISYDETNVPNRTRLELAMSRGERREVVRPARFADPPIFNELDGWRQEHPLWRNNPNLDPTPASRDAARADADHQDRIRAYRANHQEEQAAARDFEKAISYLESLRVHKRDQRPSSIRPSEQWIEEMILYNKSTAILANQSVPGPYPCSWLSAGTVFEGSQFTTHTDRGSASRIPEKWNVRVVIHGLDWKTKYVYGQMEAENLPGVSRADGSSTGGGSVITYLEGEIIDFDRHGLATRGYGSSLTADATNWRRFRALSQKEHKMDERNMARRICDREFLDENLHQKYILMRWKERYFIPESVSHSPIHHGSERSGLTISGFYYVCLTRYSGHIQAFYFDPEGAPHQELAMKPLPKSFPAPAYS